MQRNCFNVIKQINAKNIFTQRRLIDKKRRDFWLKWRRSFLRKMKLWYLMREMMDVYLNRTKVKIVKHKPTDDNAKPINVIIERTWSTNFGVDFCSISLKWKKNSFHFLVFSLSLKFNHWPLTPRNVWDDYIDTLHLYSSYWFSHILRLTNVQLD